MSRVLERLIGHDCRLDLLSCLVDGPSSVSALAARIGKPEAAVTYHLRLLEGQKVIGRMVGPGDEDAVYAATLDKHPPWIAEAVAAHKEGKLRLSATVRGAVGMKCDGCEGLLRYGSEIVAVYSVGGSGAMRARLVTEGKPGSDETKSLFISATYHHDCYRETRHRDTSLPPVE